MLDPNFDPECLKVWGAMVCTAFGNIKMQSPPWVQWQVWHVPLYALFYSLNENKFEWTYSNHHRHHISKYPFYIYSIEKPQKPGYGVSLPIDLMIFQAVCKMSILGEPKRKSASWNTILHSSLLLRIQSYQGISNDWSLSSISPVWISLEPPTVLIGRTRVHQADFGL